MRPCIPLPKAFEHLVLKTASTQKRMKTAASVLVLFRLDYSRTAVVRREQGTVVMFSETP